MVKSKKNLTAFLLSVLMLLSIIPMSVLAEDSSSEQPYSAPQGSSALTVYLEDEASSCTTAGESGGTYTNTYTPAIDSTAGKTFRITVGGSAVKNFTEENFNGGNLYITEYDTFVNADTDTSDTITDTVIVADSSENITLVSESDSAKVYDFTIPADTLDDGTVYMMVFTPDLYAGSDKSACLDCTVCFQLETIDNTLWVKQGSDGDWYLMQGTTVVPGPTVAQNEWGWWYIDENGKVDFSYTGLAENEWGWWRIEGGCVNFSAQGVYENEYGWWKVTDGYVDFDFTGLAQNEWGWWRIVNGCVDFSANGIYQNEYGWWKCKGGAVDFSFTGLAENEYGWWRVDNGCVNFNYNGIASNEYGSWYIKNGAVQFQYSGKIKVNGKTYTVKGGQIVA